MTTPPAPDLFTNVHKGLRKALFELVLALGRAEASPAASGAERALAREVVHFLRIHGENEDVLILPLLETRKPEVFRRLESAHVEVAAAIDRFAKLIDDASSPALYHAACHLAALYLEHMNLEELELEKHMRDALSLEEAAAVGPQSVARTPEAPRRRMIALILDAVPPAEAEALLAKLPPPVATAWRAGRG